MAPPPPLLLVVTGPKEMVAAGTKTNAIDKDFLPSDEGTPAEDLELVM